MMKIKTTGQNFSGFLHQLTRPTAGRFSAFDAMRMSPDSSGSTPSEFDISRALETLLDIGLRGRTDYDILGWCIDKSHCLLTFDRDFLQRGFDWWRSDGVFVCRIPSDRPHLWLPLYRVIILANRAPSEFNGSLSVISSDGFKYHYKDRINRTRINDFRWLSGRLHRRVHPGEHLLDQGWANSEVNETLGRR